MSDKKILGGDPPETMTPAQVARRWQTTAKTVRGMCDRGELDWFWRGSRRRVYTASVLAYEKAHFGVKVPAG